MKKTKDVYLKKEDNFIALIKCFVANAAYQDIKRIIRKSDF
jgi:hypothetical protein